MSKIAFVFSGQGAQYSGMGQSLYEGSVVTQQVMEQFEQLRPGTLQQCFQGSPEELKDTRNTQPTIFAVSMGAAEALKAQGIMPDVLAGFSLGEVSALTFGGGFSYRDGFETVIKRSELMAAATEAMSMGENPITSKMVAVLKLTANQVEEIAGQFTQVYPVNYNCPGQTVVAGESEELDAFGKVVKEQGGRVLPLKVSGGFHSPFMTSAAEAFAKVLAETPIKPLQIPVYANVNGQPYAEQSEKTLTEQMMQPVRWQATVENMIADGVRVFIEVGPGKTLKGLIEKCISEDDSNDISVYNVEDMETLAQCVESLRLTRFLL